MADNLDKTFDFVSRRFDDIERRIDHLEQNTETIKSDLHCVRNDTRLIKPIFDWAGTESTEFGDLTLRVEKLEKQSAS